MTVREYTIEVEKEIIFTNELATYYSIIAIIIFFLTLLCSIYLSPFQAMWIFLAF